MDPYADPLAFGQRLQILRVRRGLTRDQLGALVGKSGSWIKGLETGRLKTPKLEVVLALAESLRVHNVADLAGDQSLHADLFVGPGHPRLAAVKAAVDAFPVAAVQEASSIAHIRARLARAWSARHSAPNHREVVGALLPGLLRDAQITVRQADTGPERRAAQAVLAEVYSLSQFFVSYQPDAALLWRVAERGMVAAQELEDPHAIGMAAWLTTQAHRDAGPAHFDAADAVNLATLRYLEPLIRDEEVPPDVLAITGALTFEAGYTAARRGATGTAWRYWETARAMAGKLSEGYYHPVTSFSQAIMGAHAVTVAVELRQGGESVRQSAAADAVTIPSRPRRARHRVEQARGYHLDRQPDAALATLEKPTRLRPKPSNTTGSPSGSSSKRPSPRARPGAGAHPNSLSKSAC
ncbi:helix-turn-helix domain-containing protein [Actinoplanes couchii]|uniref:HTH cro/C1-type domain-containing protein n=1 Tax=Actinoplanes couchii TaxID=403638 RepID=A0ABQ3XRX5_9ACTN|nr:helix-turn-helix transcriptional regulator [Actinoplanes couchii]MDR6318733.1 transcriptional regulator with XRE-family HTH domain [Actinoplanes couchii]GID61261.1 hypothetical protein Aco03nite_096650 [Actinoplanes couchii]